VTSALGGSTWPEVAGDAFVLVIPLGSVEQHGPHLPLDTDTRIAVALAEGLAAARPDTVVAPALAFGASGEHAGFPGTLSIGTDALATMVVELVRSADHFAGVVLVNGHGGNLDALHAAGATLTAEGRPVVVWGPRVPRGDAHAGRTETSILLALAPDCVRLDRAEPGATAPLEEVLDDLRAGGVAAVSPNGVLGDPTDASAREGAALLDRLVTDLIGAVDRAFPR
jgi:mycofactocin system creatininase family protein